MNTKLLLIELKNCATKCKGSMFGLTIHLASAAAAAKKDPTRKATFIFRSSSHQIIGSMNMQKETM